MCEFPNRIYLVIKKISYEKTIYDFPVNSLPLILEHIEEVTSSGWSTIIYSYASNQGEYVIEYELQYIVKELRWTLHRV
jgi:hypothetical protein